MVECQLDSVVPSPHSSALTSLELTFMHLTGSNSGLLRSPGFTVSPVGKVERRKEKKKGKGMEEKGNRKGMEGRKEGRRNKKRKKDRKEEGIQGERRENYVFCWL